MEFGLKICGNKNLKIYQYSRRKTSMNDWLKIQINKYAGSNFGESELVVKKQLKAFKKIYEFIKPGYKFLDLGCNSAYITKLIQDEGCEVLGVDLPEVIAKVKYKVPVKAMDLEKELPKGLWDIIFIRETIEHLRNYQEVCLKIINLLSEDGILIITAPCDKKDGPKVTKEHVRVFEGKALDNLVKKSGGHIIEAFNEKRSRVIIAGKIK
jgi:2-polyprenyl-3-methyl-5-hydroxy-6-metoxy-1,4-benzoquinol methylase